MESRENPVFGRKVFFINPPYKVRSTVIETLRRNEYEIYIIDDYRFAKAILRRNENALCFINIDDEMPIYAWFNFVKSFENDESLKTIFVGILSGTIKKTEKDQFLLKTNIPGGFITLSDSTDDISETLTGILEINGAKGRRKYVRLNCTEIEDTTLLCTIGSKMYKLKLIDISAVGFACRIPVQYLPYFQKNSVFQSITLTLGKRSISCTAAVFGTTVKGTECTVVFLMLKGTSSETKDSIRDYVTATMQQTLENSITIQSEDTTDYTKKPKEAEKDIDKSFDQPDELEELEELDELEELEEIEEAEPIEEASKPQVSPTPTPTPQAQSASIPKPQAAPAPQAPKAPTPTQQAQPVQPQTAQGQNANNTQSNANMSVPPQYDGKPSDMIVSDLF